MHPSRGGRLPPRTKPLVAMAEVEQPVMDVTTVAISTMMQEYAVKIRTQESRRAAAVYEAEEMCSSLTATFNSSQLLMASLTRPSRHKPTDSSLAHDPRHANEQHHAPYV